MAPDPWRSIGSDEGIGVEIRALAPEIGGGGAEHLRNRLVQINDAVVLVRQQHVARHAVETDLDAHAFRGDGALFLAGRMASFSVRLLQFVLHGADGAQHAGGFVVARTSIELSYLPAAMFSAVLTAVQRPRHIAA